jgi:hypothetical protein
MSESFAALFEESLQRTEMRPGEVITAEVVRVEHNFVVVNAGLKSEAYIPSTNSRTTRANRSPVGDFVPVAIGSIENGYGDTILARHRQAPGLLAGAGKGAGVRRIRHRHHQRQGQGRPDRAGQRHPRLPARLAGRHPSRQGPDPYENKTWNSRSSSSTASATTWCCRAAPWSKPPWAKSAPS